MKNRIFILIIAILTLMLMVGCQYFADPSTPSAGEDNIADAGKGDIASNPENSDKNDSKNNTPPKNDDKTEDKEDTNPESGKSDEDTNINEETNMGGENQPDGGQPEGNQPEENQPEDNLPEIGTAVGYRFKDITLQTVSGETVSTADLRGKIVIVNSWATWCPPCREELPDFDRIATEYKDQVVIIAADVDAGSGSAKSYVEQNFPTTDIIFAYDTVYGDAYYAAGGWKYVPRTAIIDQNGVIIYSDDGAMSYYQLVAIIESALEK